jgi:xanthine dehydrogenase large subunit
VKNADLYSHVRGESIYVDDIPVRERTLYGAVFDASIAHAFIKNLDLTDATQSDGVTAILTAVDIPGDNQIGMILPDEPLLAFREVQYIGQPIALVLAATEALARAAAKKIRVEVEALPIIVDPRESYEQEQLITSPRTFYLGNIDAAWKKCDHIFEGRADVGGQEHLYIETQGVYAYPTENGGIKIFTASQSPTVIQKTAAQVLGLSMHKIEVDVGRLGGAFGGKETQATAWAMLAALGAYRKQRAVKLVLHRQDDMRMTGKRHPYSADFKIGLTKDYKIIAYQVFFYQNSGAFADLSTSVMERTLFHATNSYFIPHVKATVYCCRTHLPPNTAFRGFGGPQGMFVMEAAIARAAEALAVDAAVIQQKNLLQDGDEFPYGQKAGGEDAGPCHAQSCWHEAQTRYRIGALRKEMAAFNAHSRQYKKGLALMPICFGISFTKIHLNQAGALVHIYQDGSVGVSVAAVEMGQGVNIKMVQVAARRLAVSPDRIKMETTNTTRVANTSPTAASSGADLSGKALEKACLALGARLQKLAARKLGLDNPAILEFKDEKVYNKGKQTGMSWEQLVRDAYLDRVSLSEHAHYATPVIHFDPVKEKGNPFAYHVYGTAVITATVDRLRGTYEIDAVKVVHDFGQSMNPIVDSGQMEGGIVQGIGWMTTEEVIYDPQGRLLSDALSTYKVPDIYAAPKELKVHFFPSEGSPLAILKSKAIGEPPLMYGIGAYFAVRNAIRAAKPGIAFPFCAPLTPEKVLLALYGET